MELQLIEQMKLPHHSAFKHRYTAIELHMGYCGRFDVLIT